MGDNKGNSATVEFYSGNEIDDNATVTLNQGSLFDLRGYGDQFRNLVMQGATITTNGGVVSVLTNVTVNASSDGSISQIIGPGNFDLASDVVEFDIAPAAAGGVAFHVGTDVSDGAILKKGDGVLALSGSGNYMQDTDLEEGSIQVESSQALGTPTNGVFVASGTSILFSGSSLFIRNNLSIAGTGANGKGALYVLSGGTALNGTVTLSDDATIGAADGTALGLSGLLSDGGMPSDLTIASSGTGRVILAEDGSPFHGAIDVTGGYLRVSGGLATGAAATPITMEDGSTLELVGGFILPSNKTLVLEGSGVGGSPVKIHNISGQNGIDAAIDLRHDQEIDVDTSTQLLLGGVTGETGGSYGITVGGIGLLMMTAAETYTGTTTVNGHLALDGSLPGQVQANANTILYGNGSADTVQMNAGSAIQWPSPGVLSTGDISLDSNSSFRVTLDGTVVGLDYSQIDVSRTVDLGDATLLLSVASTASIGDVFTIVKNDGTGPVSGQFKNLPEGATIYAGANAFQISYVGGDGNDVTLTAIPRSLTWTGGGLTDHWSDSNNWQFGLVPQDGDNLVFPAGAATEHLQRLR